MGDNGIIVDIDIDWKEVEKKLSILKNPRRIKQALNIALNKTIGETKKDAREEILKAYNIKKRNSITGQLKRISSNTETLTASVITKGRPVSLAKLKHRKNTKHLTAFANPKASSSGGRTGGFKATMTNLKANTTHEGIWIRTGKFAHTTRSAKEYAQDRAKTPKGLERIKEQFGPGTSQMLANEEVIKEVEKKTKEKFDEELDKAIKAVFEEMIK